jgi:selenocysteine lyase/cysteine desulfurase
MLWPRLSKRDFLKAASFTAAAYAWKALNPSPAIAGALKNVRGPVVGPGLGSVRDFFPLSRGRVYFNNGTLGPSPTPVLEAVAKAMQEVETTGEGGDANDVALRARLASFIGVNAEEIALTHNTSDGINIVAAGLKLIAGDEVILTTHEHVGNALPWLNRARLGGIVLRSFVPPPSAAGVMAEISAHITDRTRVIAVPHLTCTTGQVFPLDEIVALARSRGIFVAVDGAHGTGMLPLNLADLGVDFYASSTHKWLCGPKGVGYLYVRKDRLDSIEPRYVGAHSDSGWHLDTTPPRIDGFWPTAHRFDYGSQNNSLYAGAVAAMDFFDRIGMANITEYGCGLALQLQDALVLRARDIEMLTPTEAHSRAMVVSFRFRDPAKNSVKFAAYAGAKGFRVRQVAEANLGAIRISTHLYNNADEVARFVDVVDQYLLGTV